MKKVFFVLLSVMICAMLVACSNGADSNDEKLKNPTNNVSTSLKNETGFSQEKDVDNSTTNQENENDLDVIKNEATAQEKTTTKGDRDNSQIDIDNLIGEDYF